MNTKEKVKEMFRDLAALFTCNQKKEAQAMWNIIKCFADEIDSLRQEIAELKQQQQ